MALLSSPIAHNHTHMLVACSSLCARVCVCVCASLHANVHKCETLCKQLYVSAAETAWEDKNIKAHSKHKVAHLFYPSSAASFVFLLHFYRWMQDRCYLGVQICKLKSRNSAKQCNWLKKWFLLILLKHLCESGLDKWYAVSHSWFATLSKAWLICWLPAKAVN